MKMQTKNKLKLPVLIDVISILIGVLNLTHAYLPPTNTNDFEITATVICD